MRLRGDKHVLLERAFRRDLANRAIVSSVDQLADLFHVIGGATPAQLCVVAGIVASAHASLATTVPAPAGGGPLAATAAAALFPVTAADAFAAAGIIGGVAAAGAVAAAAAAETGPLLDMPVLEPSSPTFPPPGSPDRSANDLLGIDGSPDWDEPRSPAPF